MQSKKRVVAPWRRAVLITAALMLVAGCGGAQDRSSAPATAPDTGMQATDATPTAPAVGADESTPGEAGELTPLQLGWVRSTANLAAQEASEFGEQFGLDIQSEHFNTAVDITTALIGGQLDVGLLTPAHFVRAIDGDTGLVQISGNVRGNTQVLVRSDLGIAQDDWDALQQLIDERPVRIASSRGSINEALAILHFAENGIDVDNDMELVNVADFGQHAQTLRGGEFDMVVTLEPIATLIVADGVGTTFTLPYDSPAGDLNTNFVVRQDWLDDNRELTQAFVNTIAAAQEHLAGDVEAQVQSGVELTGLEPEVVEQALENNEYVIENGVEETMTFAELAAERGWTERNVADEVADWVDESLVEEAQRVVGNSD